jgi:hypothetical protein
MGIITAEGKHNFKTFLHFLKFKLSSPSGILPTLSALHAILRFSMQFALKGIWLPFAMVLKAISDPFASYRKEFDYRMQYPFIFADFWILHAVANPFWQVAKRNLIAFKFKQKGASNPFK